MRSLPITAEDRALIEAARALLRKNYRRHRHSVAAAVRASSGRVYLGFNLDPSPHSACAEPVAVGAALVAGDRTLRAIVAVTKDGDRYPVLSPCGRCRQLLIDYAPDAAVLLVDDGRVVKARARDLLPGPYRNE